MEIKLWNKKKILKQVDTVNIVGGKKRRENQKKLIHPDTQAFVNLNSLTNSMTLQLCVFLLPSKFSVFSSPWISFLPQESNEEGQTLNVI